MKYDTKPILSGADIGRTKRCRHGAKPYEHCSACDAGKLHVLNLTDEELEVLIRALTFAADFQDDYYTLYPGEDYNSGMTASRPGASAFSLNYAPCSRAEALHIFQPTGGTK